MSSSEVVFIRWHVHHVAREAVHFENFDDFWADEAGGDDVKLLGV